MLLQVDDVDIHVMVMVDGTLVELSTRSSLGIHVYAYEDDLCSDLMA